MDAIAFQLIRSGNLSLLRRLLDTTLDITAREPATNRTLLHVAAAVYSAVYSLCIRSCAGYTVYFVYLDPPTCVFNT